MAGKPVLRGTRPTVDYALNLLAHGTTADDILAEYSGLVEENLQAALLYRSPRRTARR